MELVIEQEIISKLKKERNIIEPPREEILEDFKLMGYTNSDFLFDLSNKKSEELKSLIGILNKPNINFNDNIKEYKYDVEVFEQLNKKETIRIINNSNDDFNFILDEVIFSSNYIKESRKKEEGNVIEYEFSLNFPKQDSTGTFLERIIFKSNYRTFIISIHINVINTKEINNKKIDFLEMAKKFVISPEEVSQEIINLNVNTLEEEEKELFLRMRKTKKNETLEELDKLKKDLENSLLNKNYNHLFILKEKHDEENNYVVFGEFNKKLDSSKWRLKKFREIQMLAKGFTFEEHKYCMKNVNLELKNNPHYFISTDDFTGFFTPIKEGFNTIFTFYGKSVIHSESNNYKYVYIVGDFNNWEEREDYKMIHCGDNNWFLATRVLGNNYEYGILVDGVLYNKLGISDKKTKVINGKELFVDVAGIEFTQNFLCSLGYNAYPKLAYEVNGNSIIIKNMSHGVLKGQMNFYNDEKKKSLNKVEFSATSKLEFSYYLNKKYKYMSIYSNGGNTDCELIVNKSFTKDNVYHKLGLFKRFFIATNDMSYKIVSHKISKKTEIPFIKFNMSFRKPFEKIYFPLYAVNMPRLSFHIGWRKKLKNKKIIETIYAEDILFEIDKRNEKIKKHSMETLVINIKFYWESILAAVITSSLGILLIYFILWLIEYIIMR